MRQYELTEPELKHHLDQTNNRALACRCLKNIQELIKHYLSAKYHIKMKKFLITERILMEIGNDHSEYTEIILKYRKSHFNSEHAYRIYKTTEPKKHMLV